ncbi:MAG: hypothetical protein UY21_C0006G0007 [Microgenomates group bacterium GW2011_GWA1_48_10]|nr:MAG: hypothetical protein UY21_C0006G0007 [Microgenomates group bacterium GW2011_GWA1_48_10]
MLEVEQPEATIRYSPTSDYAGFLLIVSYEDPEFFGPSELFRRYCLSCPLFKETSPEAISCGGFGSTEGGASLSSISRISERTLQQNANCLKT